MSADRRPDGSRIVVVARNVPRKLRMAYLACNRQLAARNRQLAACNRPLGEAYGAPPLAEDGAHVVGVRDGDALRGRLCVAHRNVEGAAGRGVVVHAFDRVVDLRHTQCAGRTVGPHRARLPQPVATGSFGQRVRDCCHARRRENGARWPQWDPG
jgi:hypothetical protein